MADQAVKQEPKAGAEAEVQVPTRVKKKKSQPTNCTQSNKRIKRKDWYYRDGKYFANKQCFKLWVRQEAEKAKKASDEAASKAAAAKEAAATQAPSAEQPSA
jgi:hypothetical protein